MWGPELCWTLTVKPRGYVQCVFVLDPRTAALSVAVLQGRSHEESCSVVCLSAAAKICSERTTILPSWISITSILGQTRLTTRAFNNNASYRYVQYNYSSQKFETGNLLRAFSLQTERFGYFPGKKCLVRSIQYIHVETTTVFMNYLGVSDYRRGTTPR